MTICTAILISGMVSISLTPMLCSRFLREIKPSDHGLLYRALERVFQGMLSTYSISLRWVLGHRPVNAGNVPGGSRSYWLAVCGGAQGIHPGHRQRHLQHLHRVRAGHFSTTGGCFLTSSNTGRLMINLKPRRQREATVADIVNRLRPKVSGIPGRASRTPANYPRSPSPSACGRARRWDRLRMRSKKHPEPISLPPLQPRSRDRFRPGGRTQGAHCAN